MDPILRQIFQRFQIAGDLLAITPVKLGHINDTYLGEWSSGRFIHQRINSFVFPNIPELMSNVVKITEHVANKVSTQPLVEHDRSFRLVPTDTGQFFYQTEADQYWRTYECVPNAVSYHVCASEAWAYEAAQTCGRFQRYISDLDVKDFFVVIPDFFNTTFRYSQLEQAVKADAQHRVSQLGAELEFAAARENEGALIMRHLTNGELDWRVTHNDTKYNNVMFDRDSGKGVCVVDLDLCMPGTLMFDFGDLVRNASIPAAEDEVDLSKVFMNMSYFEALAKGYLGQLKNMLCPLEWDLMASAPKLLTLMLGLRFVADYINGDKYFKVNYPQHNLDRARNQFKIVKSMEDQHAAMCSIIERIRKDK